MEPRPAHRLQGDPRPHEDGKATGEYEDFWSASSLPKETSGAGRWASPWPRTALCW